MRKKKNQCIKKVYGSGVFNGYSEVYTHKHTMMKNDVCTSLVCICWLFICKFWQLVHIKIHKHTHTT